MKKKFYSAEEKLAKELKKSLTRRQFLSMTAYTGSSLAVSGILSTILGESTSYAAASLGEAPIKVCQIHAPGGPLEFAVPLLANGNPLPSNLISGYGVLPNILSTAGGTVNLMGMDWLNRSRVGTDDFIVGLQKQAQLNAGVAFSKVHAFTIASSSNDDNANNPVNLENLCTAAGFKGKLADSLAISGGLRASQALKFAFNPFSAPTSQQIRDLITYAPAFNGKSMSFLNQFSATLRDLSDLQSAKLFKKLPQKDQDQLKNSLGTAFQENQQAADPNRFGTNLDISQDTGYVSAFNSVVPGAALTTNADILAFATGLEALSKGVSNFMGYTYRQNMDYHGNNATSNNNSGTLEKDGTLGRLIGAAINIAFYRGMNLMLILTKDGACRGNPDHTGQVIATGDDGDKATQTVIFINGGATRTVTRLKTQVGARRSDSGQVDTNVLVSRNDANTGAALAAAILSANGLSASKIRELFPGIFSSDADVQAALGLMIT